MSFTATVKKVGMFKKAVNGLCNVVGKVILEISKSGMMLQSMDKDHVMVVHFTLRNWFFSKFICEKPLSLGIDFEELLKILNSAILSDDDELVIEVKEDSDKLNLTITSSDELRTVNGSLKLKEMDEDNLILPETKYPTRIEMPTKLFTSICKTVIALDECVRISFPSDTKNIVQFVAVNIDNGETSGCVKILDGHNDNVNIWSDSKNYGVLLSSEHLQTICKCGIVSDKVILYVQNDVPILIKYNIGKGDGYIDFYLAPFIDERNKKKIIIKEQFNLL